MPAAPPRPALAWVPRPLPAALRRRLAFAALGLVVVLGHRWWLERLGAWMARPAATNAVAAAPVSVWLVPPVAGAAQAPPALAETRRDAPASRPPRPARPRLPPVAAAPAAAALAPAPLAEAEPAPPSSTAPVPAWPEDGAAAGPPTYATRPPPPVRLRFAVQRGEQRGEAEWLWQHDGRQFVSWLQSALPGRTPLDHQTRGEFDAAGLAPLRMLESARGRAVRAVNFQRDKGLVSFSGSARQWPLWPGAQDRASWLPQLLAVVAAAGPWAPGQQVELAVASPRGELDRWVFALRDDQGPDAGPPGAALHWVREPQRPYDSRVDVWLDRAAPHWPLALQWQVLPGGEPLRWRLSDAPEAAPAP